MKNKSEYIVFITFSKIFRILGLNISRRLSGILAFIFFYFIPIRRNVVFKNLRIAFPDYDENKIKKIAFGSYKSFAITLIEILCLPSINRNDIASSVICTKNDFIKEKYNEGNGIIVLSAHFGNWEYIAISVAIQLGIPFSVIVKPLRNPFITEWMNKVRTKWNNEVVPTGVSIRRTYQALKEKKIVAMVADQRASADSIKIEFFSRKVSVFTGPAALALKTGAPVIIGIPVRQNDYSYITEPVEISTDNLPDDESEKIIEISKRYMAYLENVIRKYPQQWLWMHNRWKH